MEKRTATIYDFAKLCGCMISCRDCPLSDYNNDEGEVCEDYMTHHTRKANKIILKWCDENPSKKKIRKS